MLKLLKCLNIGDKSHKCAIWEKCILYQNAVVWCAKFMKVASPSSRQNVYFDVQSKNSCLTETYAAVIQFDPGENYENIPG